METFSALLPDGVSGFAAALLILASFFTSALTAAFGVGGGLAMLALLGVFVPVAALIPVHGAVQLGSNTGRAWHQRAHVRWDIVAPFVFGSLLGAFVGAFVVFQLPDHLLKLFLGLFVIAIVWTKIPAIGAVGRLALVAGSAILAVLSMMFGATGPLLSAFFAQFFANDRKALVATHGAAMIAQHGLKIIVFAMAGFAFAAWAPLILAMIATGFLGTVYGTGWLERMPEESFRRWFKIAVTLLALNMVREGLAGLI